MKIRIRREFKTVIDEKVDVTVDDLLKSFFDDVDTSETWLQVSHLLDRITTVLELIGDDRIADVPEIVREQWARRLEAQAARYAKGFR